MEVTCQKCLIKYYLDESRIKGTQAKVRCSRCQHVFTVQLSMPAEEELVPPVPESSLRSREGEGPLEESAESSSSGQLLSWLTEEGKGEAEEGPAVVAAPVAGEEAEVVPEGAAEVGRGLTPWFERWTVWALAGVVAFLGLAGGGVWYYKYKLRGPAPVTKEALTAAGESQGVSGVAAVMTELDGLQIEESKPRYRGLVNKGGGQLLVVQGRVKNNSSQAKGPVALKLILTDARHQPVSQVEFYSGSVFTDEELIKWPPEDLQRWLSTPGGRSQRPVIGPGEAQGFTGVLMGVPSDLAERGYGYNLLIVKGPSVGRP